MNPNLVIAIDGPAGAGKSTISKILARDLGLSYLDTGAMYRALALKASREQLDFSDGERLAELLNQTTISFGQGEPQPVILDGEDVTSQIRTPEVAEAASTISAHSPVRRAMVELQQRFVSAGGFILEGRDATTVIAPNANLKIYLTASLEERAKRRLTEFEAKGQTSAYDEVRTQIQLRDHRDITREDSPLRVVEGALLIDSANMTIDAVVQKIKDSLPA